MIFEWAAERPWFREEMLLQARAWDRRDSFVVPLWTWLIQAFINSENADTHKDHVRERHIRRMQYKISREKKKVRRRDCCVLWICSWVGIPSGREFVGGLVGRLRGRAPSLLQRKFLFWTRCCCCGSTMPRVLVALSGSLALSALPLMAVG